MTVRIAACLLVLIGCGYMGSVFANCYKKRLYQLEELENAVMQMEFDIDFLNIPICESFDKIAAGSEKGIGDIFRYVSSRLRENRGADAARLWERAVSRYRHELFLNDDDLRILMEFSKSIGHGDREKELGNIKMAAMRFKIAAEEARGAAAKNVKMYRGLGYLTGIFIITVLL